MDKDQKVIGFVQEFIDTLSVIACWACAYIIRFSYFPMAQQGIELTFVKLTPLLVILTLYHFSKNELYRSQRFTNRYSEIFNVIKANIFTLISFVLVIYFFGDSRISRMTILIYSLLSTTVLIIVRISMRNYLRYLRTKGKGLKKTLLIGDAAPLTQYIETARRFKDSGIHFIGWIDSQGKAPEYNIAAIDSSYEELKEKTHIDTIVISYDSKNSQKVEQFISKNHNDIVPIQILPDLSYSLIGHNVDHFAGIPLLALNQPSFQPLELFLKRLMDFLGSLIGLILLAPFLSFIAILIKLSSKGPIFYGQERIGLNGRLFKMWKFRTMKVATENEDQTEWSSKDNPRKTKLGDFLRKTSLDELPQLWNVLIGQMSLVGPRPERPFFVEKFRHEIPGYMLRHKMRAGITGWAQVNGWRGDTDLFKRIECDIFYIKSWSLWFDLKILFLTIFKGLINKNAY